MTSPSSVPESSLAREVFGPLGGIVVLAATAEGVPVAVGRFAERRRAELDHLLGAVQEAGAFGDGTMALVDELGWHRDHDATPFLLMWSGFIEPYPFDTGDPAVVARMVEMGADLQTVQFLHALLAAALTRHAGAAGPVASVAEALRTACALLGGVVTPPAVFRTWRVTHLAGILRPDSPTPGEARERWRDAALRLEALLAPAVG
ncbi:hypothetical protein ACL02R_21250 [Streptomyces sp. MS19]|uniref:hypothetical protein n=1 Tax=Streptomyces sp. MS19 TaxID=3385972 RepID=UPI0039A09600